MTTVAPPSQLCTFRVADLWLGVDVLDVQEVIRHQPTTPVPLAPDVVEGLVNLRGEIVMALDMRTRLALPPRDTGDLPSNVVIRSREEHAAVSLLVDEVGDVIDVDGLDFELAPETLTGPARDIVLGAYPCPSLLLLLLDVQRTVGLLAGGHRP